MVDPRQLSLPLQSNLEATFSSFVVGDNQQLVTDLQLVANNQGEQFIYLWGTAGSGRSHLLQALCFAAGEAGIMAAYLPLSEPELPPDILQGMAEYAILALDDVDSIAGNQAWEESLFHCFNQVRDSGGHLIVSSQAPATKIGLNLPDLSSRLSWGLTYQLKPLSDQEKRLAMQTRANMHGLQLSEEVAQYMLTRMGRDLTNLMTALAQLEQASLSEQRRLTIPYVKQTLGL